MVLLDAEEGSLIRDPEPDTLSDYQAKQKGPARTSRKAGRIQRVTSADAGRAQNRIVR